MFEAPPKDLVLANFVDGDFFPAQSGGTLEIRDPSRDSCLGSLPDSGPEDVDHAVAAAQAAFPEWSKTSVEERAQWLETIADAIDHDAERLAWLESFDQGKPLELARTVDIPRAAQNFRFFASAIRHSHAKAFHQAPGTLSYTTHQPLGVAGLISPWNLPLYLLTWKIAPALATGNTCVAKPSEVTSVTAFALAEILSRVGLPAGVVNLVFGTGPRAGQALVEHPDVPLISFTGGTQTGARIAAVAAPKFKKLSLELGGKNPNLIFEDADLERAVSTSVRAAFTNQGEICLCGSRIYVQAPIYDAFLERFVAATKALVVGDPRAPGTQLGALVSRAHFEKVSGYLELARSEGATFPTGGGPPELQAPFDKGCFLRPTIVEGLDPNSRVASEEIFGPVVTIHRFFTEEEAVELANRTPYGLAATVFTQDLDRAHRVAPQIRAGTVWLNTWMRRDLRVPFGGMKASGVGREGGEHSLAFFTEAQTICLDVKS